jgi:tetratricopeptide (TPR) repeat protein
VGFAIASVTPYQYLLTQSEVILHYLWLAFVPVNQTVDYIDWPMAQSLSSVWPAFITVITLLAASIVLLFIRPAAGFIGLWFFAILAPTSSFMPIIDPVFEHRMYLSLAAVALGVVLGLEALVRRIPCPPRLTFGIEVSLLSIATLSLLVLTYQRNETYRSLQAALEDNISRRPGNPRPMSSLAAVLLNANDPERAGEWIERGLHIPGPVAPLLYRQKAYWLAMVGRFDEAEQVYRYLVRIDYNFYASPPDYRNAAWFLIGRGKAQEAAELMRALIAHQPQVADNHFILATAELALGRESAAREAAGTAQRLDPSTAARAGAVARALVFAKESAATPILKPRAMWQAAAACLADGDQDPLLLDTLAMAYAWNHEFTQAAAAARRGITAAEKRGERDWAIALRARLKLYETGKAYTKAD